MDYAFANIKDLFIVIYLDELTVFSKKAADRAPEAGFQKMRKVWILNKS